MKNLYEHSAGGVIFENGKVLLILMKNLKGEKVWTFPKGHLENGESSRNAAMREVEEETGYKCSILKKIMTAHYRFTRNGRLVEKDVDWYLMKTISGAGKPADNTEIFDMKRLEPQEAKKILTYESDFQIMDIITHYD